MKVAMFIMLAFLGIASAGKLGGHGHHDDHHHGHTQPSSNSHNVGRNPRPSSGRPGQFGSSSGQSRPGQGSAPSGGQGRFPGQGSSGQGQFGTSPALSSGPSSEDILIDASFNGILTFDNHACIFRNGELRLRGKFIMIGENEDYKVQSGTATLRTGETVSIDSGLFNVRLLEYSDNAELQSSLARLGVTLDQLEKQTGTVPQQQGIYDVTAGVMSIDGVLKNMRAGVIIAVASQVVSSAGGSPSRLVPGQFARESSGFIPGQGSGSAPGQSGQGPFGTSPAQSGQGQFGPSSGGQGQFGPSSGGQGQFGPSSGGQGQFGPSSGGQGQFGPSSGGQGQFGPSSGGQGQFGPSSGGQGQFGDSTQTVTITETAAHETSTVSEPVTLTKTRTRDDFVTITSPVYNSIAVTITNLVKATVTVPEEQVIRSPVAGGVVVNTIPVPSQTVLTVSVRTTNYFVSTVIRQDTQQHSLFVTNYSIGTATVRNPTTSTVVQTITQTRVATVFNTSTVGSTVYRTVTTTVSIGGGGGNPTTAPGGGYNY